MTKDNFNFIRPGKRVVIKIGTSLLTDQSRGINSARIAEFARSVAQLRATGVAVTIVTSGAIGAGVAALGLASRPKRMPDKQAAAAIGQPILMAAYDRQFAELGLRVAQILLTADDFAHRTRFVNARRTLASLFRSGVIPVINENDTVTVDEIKLGDNDNLSALVATLIDADLLVLLSDVNGLYSDDPRSNPEAELIPVVEKITPSIERLAKTPRNPFGTGGMVTKIQAAKRCTTAGIAMIIANGSLPHVLDRIFSGEGTGTLFLPASASLSVRKNWIGFIARPRGTVTIDDGACNAVLRRHTSLLPSGILSVSGEFRKGDTVTVCDAAGRAIARGIAEFTHAELSRIRGKKTSDIESILGRKTSGEAIHKNNLTITADHP
jgi:glutamate 5-kinase